MTPYFKTPKNNHYFFGYYDKSPVSLDNSKHLALEVDFINRLPDRNDNARVGYFDLVKNDVIFNELTTTKTFNWQQGCMLQWFGDKNTQIIYNDLVDEKFVSIIFNLKTKDKIVLPLAIYTLSNDSKFALCIDNERHYWIRRGYSYDGIYNQEKNKNIVENDGIYLLDIDNKQIKRIINIVDVINNKPLSNMQNGAHYLEHIMISPNNQRFVFVHRWKTDDGGIYTRLYTANIDGKGLYLLNDSGRISHFCWKNNSQIFGWGGTQNTINRLRKYKNIVKFFIKPLLPLYKKIVSGNAIDGVSKISSLVTGDSYILFDDKSSNKQKIPLNILNQDGHPSFSPTDLNWIVTDTYPDRFGVLQLILFNIKTKEKIVVDKLKSMQVYDNSPNRCDLHPKWSFDGEFVSVDTMNDGVRGIYVYKID
ncbi:hypothetical protein OAV81_02790 [Candidatus Thioglobus sp.]|jgi:hypothetical protein|nr:hypothetical protein [Candidatus Thioglobus sp.]